MRLKAFEVMLQTKGIEPSREHLELEDGLFICFQRIILNGAWRVRIHACKYV
jgi:hypothetical protein